MRRRVQIDLASLERRQLIAVVGGLLVILAVVVGLVLIITGGGREPVAEAPAATTAPTATPSPSPSLPPSPAGPPTETPTPGPTATLEPYQYTVQAGDTLYFIIQMFGYRTLDVVPEVIALNGMADENDLKADQVLLIPRQTPTPGPTLTPSPLPPEGSTPVDPNLTPDYSGCSVENRCISPDGQFWIHEVVEGDTPAGLAFAYDTTVPDILRENMLTEASFIRPGQILRILIKVTLTPTLTPTGGPDATPTPTPTLAPPSLLAPSDGATIPAGQPVVLQWAANQPLPGDAYYLVQIRSTETGEEFLATTRSNIYRLPSSLQPGAGRSVRYEWRVVIVSGPAQDSPVISGQGGAARFTWGS